MKEQTKPFIFSYQGSFLVLFSTILIGFIIETLSNGSGLRALSFPFNVIVLAELFILIPLAFILYKKNALVKWLSSVPAAIAAIVAMTMLVLLIGFIPVEAMKANPFLNRIGFGHLFHSWPYFIASLQMIIILGFTVVRRIVPFTLRNVAFFLNHFGLWMILVSASLGSGDLTRLTMFCHLNTPTNLSADDERNQYQMPFTITLHQFTIEEFNPTLVLISRQTGEIIKTKSKENLVEKGKDYKLNEWSIHVEDFIPYASRKDSAFVAKDTLGAVAAALVRIDHQTHWISSGNSMNLPSVLNLDASHSIALTVPQPKRYKSEITLSDCSFNKTFTLEVNKPFSYKGWEIYQTGFDERKGKWSDLSIIEAVRDPWLPAVFAGIYILIAGSLLMFWIGKRKNEETNL